MITIVRHGETDASEKYIASGRSSRAMGLNSSGKAKAFRIGGTLPHPPQSIVSSNYGRTAQTAEIVAAGFSPVVRKVDPELDEVDYGDFDGRPWLDYGQWLNSHGLDVVPPGGGESWLDCLGRSLRALVQHAKSDGHSVVVCHGYQWSAIETYVGTSSLPSVGQLGAAPYCQALTLTTTDLVEMTVALDGLRVPLNSASVEVREPHRVLTDVLVTMGFSVSAVAGGHGLVFRHSDQLFVSLEGSTLTFLSELGDGTHQDLVHQDGVVTLSLLNPHNAAFVTQEALMYVQRMGLR